jgi:hypothetical protein
MRLRAPDQHQDGRAIEDLVLELPGDSHAASRHRFAIQDQQVELPFGGPLDHHRFGGAFDEFDDGRTRFGAATDAGEHLPTHASIVAVDKDPSGRLLLLLVTHKDTLRAPWMPSRTAVDRQLTGT